MSGIGFGQDGHEKYAGPGHWNDPDMLVVGKVGWGSPHPTKLTPNEQVTHITLWSLLSAPLLDRLRHVAARPVHDGAAEQRRGAGGGPGSAGQAGRPQGQGRAAWRCGRGRCPTARSAVGLFNRGGAPAEVTAHWADIGVKGEQPVRDLWRQKDLGSYNGLLQGHGAAPRGGARQDRQADAGAVIRILTRSASEDFDRIPRSRFGLVSMPSLTCRLSSRASWRRTPPLLRG